MKILFLGDIVGKPGRLAVRSILPRLIASEKVAFVIANCENVAGGKGVEPKTVAELLEAGIDVLTSGNHIWRNKEICEFIEREPRLLRPANYPPGVPGAGTVVRETPEGHSIAVLNLLGRVFMDDVDCPFQSAQRLVAELRREATVVIVDMHGEATSEKAAMGWMLAGRVAAVIGSHTHVQTADERVLPGGTAYVTDAGMCGPIDSVIGVRREQVIQRFLTHMPAKFEVASGPVSVQGVIVEVDPATGTATGISRLQERVER
ncbi:MAG: TIGR00282 family metallophosphoesterase [Deltaproteobacteria bacterium]|nr:TIGR00282 family metallophosphoesterase [Deltaproteobacteria bacterium]